MNQKMPHETVVCLAHRIHGPDVFTYMNMQFIFVVNVGKYTSPMDAMGYVLFYPASIPRYFLFQAYSPRDEPMGPCILRIVPRTLLPNITSICATRKPMSIWRKLQVFNLSQMNWCIAWEDFQAKKRLTNVNLLFLP